MLFKIYTTYSYIYHVVKVTIFSIIYMAMLEMHFFALKRNCLSAKISIVVIYDK